MKIKKILCFLLAAVLVIEGGEGLVSRKAEAAINYTGSMKKNVEYQWKRKVPIKERYIFQNKVRIWEEMIELFVI